ncbi:hypothetical protein HLRTI_001295 [Halorhabdus tiamatea SARL4B]|uniref:Conserved hypothetical membrane protein n=1 Tax=Halorhabdus tiamatea SARL4B TaxID=1033806 RepID=F7PPP2_9EURY|nr:hypothetical protein [Halorhabdus tiamatea]ERJ06589.1 hypothetical protein HLRTI_001295 [Halorhabdus tiamatea SARL4B]CCQ32245.1 conserved hypothetical membrane protein [Halorhabdus tiamatea SARL4B]
MISNTRLYGASIAFATGLYSLWSASATDEMVTGGWLMPILGGVVLVHGTVLLTKYADADRLGTTSGLLMIGYAAIMLLNQALLANGMLDDGSGMGMDGDIGGSAVATGMGWDAGMVALAVLMRM